VLAFPFSNLSLSHTQLLSLYHDGWWQFNLFMSRGEKKRFCCPLKVWRGTSQMNISFIRKSREN